MVVGIVYYLGFGGKWECSFFFLSRCYIGIEEEDVKILVEFLLVLYREGEIFYIDGFFL